MQIKRIRDFEQFAAVRDDWRRLTGPHPFRSWEWACAWWQNYAAEQDELFVLTAQNENGVTVGICPWFLETRTAGTRALRFLGSGETCTDHLSVYLADENAAEALRAFADWMVKHADGRVEPAHRWDVLDLDYVTVLDLPVIRLIEQLGDCGCSVHQRETASLWRIELPATWEDFLSGHSKSRRKRLRRWERYWQQPQCQFHIVETVEGLPRGIETLIDLHQRRRRSLQEEGCFTSPQFTTFIQQVVAALQPRGNLLLSRLEREGRPLASELSFVDEQGVYLYQSGLDPAAIDESPGNVITARLIHEAIARSLRYVDFLRGDEAYKAVWGAAAVPAFRYRIAAAHTWAQLKQNCWVAGVTLKEWVKGTLSR